MNIRLTQTCTVLDSDVETPISLFLRHAGEEEAVLLESAEVDGRWGRYSVIAADFLLCLSCRNGNLSLDIRDKALAGLADLEGRPFMEGLRKLMAALHVEGAKAPAGNGGKEKIFPPITRALYGYFGYGVAGLMEPKLASRLRPEDAEACLALPGTMILFDHVYNRVCRLRTGSGQASAAREAGTAKRKEAHAGTVCTGPMHSGAVHHGADYSGVSQADTAHSAASRFAPKGHTLGAASPSMSRQAYLAVASGLKERIRGGDAIQVVPSVRFEAPFAGDPFTVYRRLRRINPSPYMFFMRLPGITLLGSSPEVMVGCEGGALRLCPIAGTRPRGREEREDNLFEEELVRDPKEQSEHVMLVDLGRNDLGRVAAPGTVELERYMEVERFSHVMHLTSHIKAELAPGKDALDVLAATFPAGTVSGAPKIRAMELIADAEPCPRGPYAGAIGWLGLDKDAVHMDTGITIRSLWVRDGKAHWQAGGGVVYDSSPEAEWKEINQKAASVLAAMTG